MPDFPPLSPVPLCLLENKGDLVSAVATCDGATLALGYSGQVLGVSATSPTGLAWQDLYESWGFLSCTEFTSKGDILTGTGLTQPNEITSTALPVGTNAQILQADSTATSGISWVDAPVFYTDKNQLLVSDEELNYCALSTNIIDSILYYNNSSPLRWTPTFGACCYTSQFRFVKGTLEVGTGLDQSGKFIVSTVENSTLVTCTQNAFGVVWKNFSQSPPTSYCEFGNPGMSYGQSSTTLIGAGEGGFNQGDTVFVSVNTGLYLVGVGQSKGCYWLSQGCEESYCIPYGFGAVALIGEQNCCRTSTTINYIFKNWCATCPLKAQVTYTAIGEEDRAALFNSQVTAFALRP